MRIKVGTASYMFRTVLDTQFTPKWQLAAKAVVVSVTCSIIIRPHCLALGQAAIPFLPRQERGNERQDPRRTLLTAQHLETKVG